MPSRIDPAAATNAFARQVQLGASMRAADQDEQTRALAISRGQAINALGQNPNATPEQYIRAGDAATGNALAGLQGDQANLRAQAFPRVGAIAAQVSTITDPLQKRAAFKQAILQNGQLFDTMGMPHTDALAKLDTLDDAGLDATLAKLSTYAPKAAPQDVAPGHSLVRPTTGGGFEAAYTAPAAPGEAGSDFSKVDPKDYTPASVAKFQTTHNHADLVARTPVATPTSEPPQFQKAAELRKEFNSQSATFRGVADSYQRIQDSASDPSAAGDLSLIFNFMKVLDPGSTVREGEFATAQNAGGVDDRVAALYNRVMKGERLSTAQRGDFTQRATRLYRGQESRFKTNVTDKYTSLAKRYGLDPNEVIGEVNASVPTESLPPTNAKGWALHLDAQGNRAYVSPDGKQFEEVPK